MRTTLRTSLPVLLIVLGILACAVPAVPLVDQSAGATAVAQTVEAIIQLTREAGEVISEVASDTPTIVPTSTLTFTPVPPTFTPTATFTPPPTFTATYTFTPVVIFTPTPLFPSISVSVPTNCRLGPGKVYDMVGALLVGESAQVYARDPASNYWYIRNPDAPTGFCWVWGEFATVTGLVSGLPVYTPPPSPTPTMTSTPSPGFEASFDGLDSCSGWWADFDLHNTGLITFKSVSMTVRDTVTSTVITGIYDGFTDNTGCASTLRKALLPAKHAVTSSPKFSYDPNNHKLKVTITLCSETGLNGTCTTQNLTFTP